MDDALGARSSSGMAPMDEASEQGGEERATKEERPVRISLEPFLEAAAHAEEIAPRGAKTALVGDRADADFEVAKPDHPDSILRDIRPDEVGSDEWKERRVPDLEHHMVAQLRAP